MQNLNYTIIEFIQKNNLSAADVSDALGKKGEYRTTHKITSNITIVGEVFYIGSYGSSNWDIHKYIKEAPQDSIVLIDLLEPEDKSLFGELVSKYLFEIRKVKAVVTNGKIRDFSQILNAKYPIWFIGTNPIGCFNAKPETKLPQNFRERKTFFSNAISICDDDGVVVIKNNDINENLLHSLNKIKEREALWKKDIFENFMNTFDVICLKKSL